ncbi:MAG TPA: septum formation initiator [Stellaceae bacterium]|nr:septum formation initiator [Stellaceae bacterium]
MSRRPLAIPVLAALLVLGLCFPAVYAQQGSEERPPAAAERQRPSPGKPEAAERKASASASLPADAVTTHSVIVDGRELAYTATAGTISLANEKGERSAEIFYVAYSLTGAPKASRPITFAFNGGPGAGSAYLQVGALGPRVLDYGTGRELPFTSGKVIDNPDTWLDLTDLVFIDPVESGYSRSTLSDDETRKEFLGVRQDLDEFGGIIHQLLTHLDRMESPVYLAGESYGGFRAARLPRLLAAKEGIVVRGAVLISPALEFSLLFRGEFNPMPWVVRIPSYAAVVLEAQGKLSPAALADAEHFALGDYLTGIVTPISDPAAATRFYQTIADLIGVPEPTVARWRGRVPLGVFLKEARHGDQALLSRYDGSVAAPDAYPASYSDQGGDPVLAGLNGPLTSGFVNYARDELNFKTDRRYMLLNGDLGRHWNWREGEGGFGQGSADASDDLREGLALEPRLHVLIAHGMTDLQTPYLGSRYVISQLPESLTRDRVRLALYEGGHMMYLRPASRAALHRDARAIYAAGE